MAESSTALLIATYKVVHLCVKDLIRMPETNLINWLSQKMGYLPYYESGNTEWKIAGCAFRSHQSESL